MNSQKEIWFSPKYMIFNFDEIENEIKHGSPGAGIGRAIKDLENTIQYFKELKDKGFELESVYPEQLVFVESADHEG